MMDDPAISLPLLLGLAHSSGYSGKGGWAGGNDGGIDNGETIPSGSEKSGTTPPSLNAVDITNKNDTTIEQQQQQQQHQQQHQQQQPHPHNSQNQQAKQAKKSSPAKRLLQNALVHYRAHRTLRRVLLRWIYNWRERNAGDEGVGHCGRMRIKAASSSVTLHPKGGIGCKIDPNYGTDHFLFQSLLHPSMPVRRAAGRMILHSIHSLDDASITHVNTTGEEGNTSSSSAALSKLASTIPRECLQEVLIILIHNLFFEEPPYKYHCDETSLSTQTTPSAIAGARNKSILHHAQGGDPAIQLMGMLTCLICEGGFGNVIVEKEWRRLRSNIVNSSVDDDGGNNKIKEGIEIKSCATSGKEGDGAGGNEGDMEESKEECNKDADGKGDPAAQHDTTMQDAKEDAEGGEAAALVGNEGNKDCEEVVEVEEDILCNSLLQQLSSNSIESFVASSGLRWACGSILRLVHMLVYVPNDPNNGACDSGVISGTFTSSATGIGKQQGVDRLDDVTAEMIQTRLLLLIDLVYRVVLYGSVPAAVDRHHSSLTSISTAGSNGDVSEDGKGDNKDNNNSTSKSSKKKKQSVLYDLASASSGGIGETSRTLSLRQSLRSSIAAGSLSSPPLSGTSHHHHHHRGHASSTARGKRARSGSSGGGSAVGDGPFTNPNVAEENRSRRELRKASLERVHRIFWSSNLPAAICHPLIHESNRCRYGGVLSSPAGDVHDNEEDTNKSPDEEHYQGSLSPLACLISAYEILRAPPSSLPTLATHGQLRGLEKGISTLGRMVDPAAGAAVVVTNPEIPWEVASLLGGLRNVSGGSGTNGGEKRLRGENSSSLSRLSGNKRRDRSCSHASQESHRSRSSSVSPRRNRLHGAGSASATGGANYNAASSILSSATTEGASNTAKRTRTPGSVASVLERLTQVDSSLRDVRGGFRGLGGATSSGAMALSAASASGGTSTSSLFGSRYRTAMMESLLGLGAGRESGVVLSEASRSHARGNAAASVAAGGAAPAIASSNSSSPNRPSLLRSRAMVANQSPRDEDGWRLVGEDDDNDEDMETVEHDDEIIDEEDGEVCDEEVESDFDDHDPDGGGDGEEEEDDEDDGSCEDEDDEHFDEEKSESESEDNGQFDDAVIVLDEVASVTAANSATASTSRNNPHRQPATSSVAPTAGGTSGGSLRASESGSSHHVDKKDREKSYICAAMQLLGAHYPDMAGKQHRVLSVSRRAVNPFSIFLHPTAMIPPPLLTSNAEQSLLRSMCDIVKPPRKPLNLKIFMRRAPTQEEFFRGSLSRNPITLSSLSAGTASTPATSGGEDRRTSGAGMANESSSHGNNEPRVRDLRQHIADDLQMSDSAELLELLVGNKILDMNLKLRVVQQVLWKKYVMENSTSASSLISGAGPGHQMINTGSGLSMIFSSSSLTARSRGAGSSGANDRDDDVLLSSFPPMVVTYRLAGVDGEATEDKVEMEDLQDPEAPGNISPEAKEIQMEKEFGITRIITQSRGVSIILSSIESTISELLRRIRRDEIARRRQMRSGPKGHSSTDGNVTREIFAKSKPCSGLIILRHCANLAENRKKLLAARAPTVLLRMLLDILNAMNRSSKPQITSAVTISISDSMDVDEAENTDTDNVPSEAASGSNAQTKHDTNHMEGNPTTDTLQEIIEMLASDISAEVTDCPEEISRSGSFANLNQGELQGSGLASKDDDGTLPLVLKSLHSTQLSPPLRKVIAKLLPFLTYGQVSQSKELASYFLKYINVSSLGMMEVFEQCNESILMTTFVETAINLPPVSVCDNLRKELIQNGFVKKVLSFVMEDAPLQPAPWTPALYSKSSGLHSKDNTNTESKEEWRRYFDRPGLNYAIKILTGLCSRHSQTQLLLSDDIDGHLLNLLTLCHWIESTSDNTTSGIKTNDLGILAETLLDELKQDNKVASDKINSIRKKTRDRKREIAEERRNKALVGMSAFGPIAGSVTAENKSVGTSSAQMSASNAAPAASENRSASMFASMFGLSAFSASSLPPSSQSRDTASASKIASGGSKVQPSWMAEMEAMDDEAFSCAVCQEGRTLQPSELLGLYAFVKKVTISSSQAGAKHDIDGTNMLLALPISLPNSLPCRENLDGLFRKGKNAADALQGSHALSPTSIFITTVSAGNAIHCSCHSKAKAADRSNPKAPKSEWEGATLRNSRVTCNVILPLVSSKISKVPLMAVEAALADVNTVVTNTLGVRPKSMLWIVLHDLRFLLLRMAYGEALNADCGGGSSSSNFLLLLYQLYTADMYAINAEHDESPEVSKHARGLSSGFVAAVNIVEGPSFDRYDARSKRLDRGVADSAPMAALCSILFLNSEGDESAGKVSESKAPSPKRQFEVHKYEFLTGLIKCAGQRHSRGVTDSGCVTSRGIPTGRKNVERARSFADWATNDVESSVSAPATATRKRHGTTMINEYSVALRPMITLYAIFDQLSKEFVVNNDDESTELSSGRLASKLETCYKAESIQDLLRVAEVTMDHESICKIFERGALV